VCVCVCVFVCSVILFEKKYTKVRIPLWELDPETSITDEEILIVTQHNLRVRKTKKKF